MAATEQLPSIAKNDLSRVSLGRGLRQGYCKWSEFDNEGLHLIIPPHKSLFLGVPNGPGDSSFMGKTS